LRVVARVALVAGQSQRAREVQRSAGVHLDARAVRAQVARVRVPRQPFDEGQFDGFVRGRRHRVARGRAALLEGCTHHRLAAVGRHDEASAEGGDALDQRLSPRQLPLQRLARSVHLEKIGAGRGDAETHTRLGVEGEGFAHQAPGSQLQCADLPLESMRA
jgi:hypothetical protein